MSTTRKDLKKNLTIEYIFVKLLTNNLRHKEWRDKISKANKKRVGSKAPNWKGGLTPLYRSIRNHSKYKEYRLKVLARDKYTCQECNKVGEYLEIHHIKSFAKIIKENKIKTMKKALKNKELWNLDNMITLCKECHKVTDNYLRHLNTNITINKLSTKET